MKTQDKVTITISLAALVPSTATAVSYWVGAARATKAQERRAVYNAYNLADLRPAVIIARRALATRF